MNQIPDYLKDESDVYFAAVNSAEGFRSYFSRIFSVEKLSRLVILKGGPGTGKSTMLKAFSEYAKQAGYHPRYFLCSSDPKSLDAVLIEEAGVAVVDGTSPHSMEALCPGAVEVLFDAGEFWDLEVLREQKDALFALVRQKAGCYRRGFQLLKSAGELFDELRSLAIDGLDGEKMRKAAARQFSKLVLDTAPGECVKRQISAFNAHGLMHLPTFLKRAHFTVKIAYANGAGLLYLDVIRALAREKGIAFLESDCPTSPRYAHALYFPNDEVLFCLEDFTECEEDNRVNMSRFQSKFSQRMHRNQMRFLHKCADALLTQAADCCCEAARVHAQMEDTYVAAMDFERLQSAWQERMAGLL